ncbi:unnamed protein product [Protopolystoma xenopodis]|uniref:Uncharacterized protein n=1 Tax=Protopolystoma xenopodis TaxID=117903 RepID=A0A448X4E9_9PLAT|nr:unnamed protein product [Protopolystoma xenopodis]
MPLVTSPYPGDSIFHSPVESRQTTVRTTPLAERICQLDIITFLSGISIYSTIRRLSSIDLTSFSHDPASSNNANSSNDNIYAMWRALDLTRAGSGSSKVEDCPIRQSDASRLMTALPLCLMPDCLLPTSPQRHWWLAVSALASNKPGYVIELYPIH